jgi:hypothetical protein
VFTKAGIAALAVAATLVSVSPLAFADAPVAGSSVPVAAAANGPASDAGLVNISDNSITVPLQACNNDFPIQGGVGQAQVPVKEITGALGGALGLLGTATSTATTSQTADNSRTCGGNSGSAGSTNTQR